MSKLRVTQSFPLTRALVGALLIPFGAVACSGTADPTEDSRATSDEGGLSGSGSDAGERDPQAPPSCDEIDEAGLCLSSSVLALCDRRDLEDAELIECETGTSCRLERGVADCYPSTERCSEGATRCSDTGRVETCTADELWEETSCTGECRDTPIGVFCSNVRTTEEYSATLEHEARSPNQALDDWGDAIDVPSAGVLIWSFDNGELVDVVQSDEAGDFSISIGSPLTEILAELILPGRRGEDAALIVADPGLSAGSYSIFDAGTDGSPKPWSVSWRTEDVPSGATYVVSEEQGSAAFHIFSTLREGMSTTEAYFPDTAPLSLVAWFGLDTAWDCGSCFFPDTTGVETFSMESQLWLDGDPIDAPYWSRAVTMHELGHWAMASFGTAPAEGGGHCLAEASFPGLAWSEGWATAYSSIIRNDPLYVTQQDEVFQQVHLANRTYNNGFTWTRPDPDGGVLQSLDQNEVAAMIWSLAQEFGTETVMSGLATSRATSAPERGYEAQEWELVDCTPTDASGLGFDAPTFADYLDGLVCLGTDQTDLERAIGAATYYPYVSSQVDCDL